MWLPDEEESVWGNLLYDLTYMIASNIKADNPEELRHTIAQKIVDYIDKPSTKYSGKYYGNEHGRSSG